jgi:aspartyl-tRNA(Asn)/glutamyl-tRNA(Gln) amidotransferase subunit A
LNLCALAVPCGFTGEGLPIGLSIYGKAFQEDMVLRVGYAFQQATDWHRRRPDLTWIESAAG